MTGRLKAVLKPTRGLTLVECLVFVAIWSSVAMTSLWALTEASRLRGNAAMRAELGLVAQSVLEEVRGMNGAELAAGARNYPAQEWWPTNTSCTVTMAQLSPAAWEINVAVSRSTPVALKPVRLTTIREAGQ